MATLTNIAKNSAALANTAKAAVATLTNATRNLVNDFLLMESGDYLLLEDGGKIILEQTTLDGVALTNIAKN